MMESKVGDEVDDNKKNNSDKYDEENQQCKLSTISYDIIANKMWAL
jgi:hypothetical protein